MATESILNKNGVEHYNTRCAAVKKFVLGIKKEEILSYMHISGPINNMVNLYSLLWKNTIASITSSRVIEVDL